MIENKNAKNSFRRYSKHGLRMVDIHKSYRIDSRCNEFQLLIGLWNISMSNRPVMYKIFNSSVRKMKQHMNCLPLYGKHTTVIHVKLPEGNSNCWLNHQTNQPVIIPTQTHHVPFIARPCEPTVMLRRPPERPNISEVLKDCWSIRL